MEKHKKINTRIGIKRNIYTKRNTTTQKIEMYGKNLSYYCCIFERKKEAG